MTRHAILLGALIAMSGCVQKDYTVNCYGASGNMGETPKGATATPAEVPAIQQDQPAMNCSINAPSATDADSAIETAVGDGATIPLN